MTAPQQFSPPAATPPEHAALLESPGRFDSLWRKNDFLDDGVAAVFGIQGVEARLQAVLFQADRFTPGEAEQWLRDRGFPAVRFTEAAQREEGPGLRPG